MRRALGWVGRLRTGVFRASLRRIFLDGIEGFLVAGLGAEQYAIDLVESARSDTNIARSDGTSDVHFEFALGKSSPSNRDFFRRRRGRKPVFYISVAARNFRHKGPDESQVCEPPAVEGLLLWTPFSVHLSPRLVTFIALLCR